MINKYKQLIYLYKIYYEKNLKNNKFNKLYGLCYFMLYYITKLKQLPNVSKHI